MTVSSRALTTIATGRAIRTYPLRRLVPNPVNRRSARYGPAERCLHAGDTARTFLRAHRADLVLARDWRAWHAATRRPSARPPPAARSLRAGVLLPPIPLLQ